MDYAGYKDQVYADFKEGYSNNEIPECVDKIWDELELNEDDLKNKEVGVLVKEYVYGDEYFSPLERYFDDFFDDIRWSRGYITGNSDGSYFCNRTRAKNAVRDMMFDRDFIFHLEKDWGYEISELADDPERLDVLAREFTIVNIRDQCLDYFKREVEDRITEQIKRWKKVHKC